MDKRELRRGRWAALREAGAARFPGAVGRIPNFTGAEAAAEQLAAQGAWRRAEVLQCNPDLPQRPVRHRALKQGKLVYLPVAQLAGPKPFLLLDPRALGPARLWHASSIQGALELGRPIAPARMSPVDLVVAGCVAVSRDGARLGRGGGYGDLAYALLRETGLVGPRTPVFSTVHATQVVRAGTIPMLAHDVALDGYATATSWVRCAGRRRRPRGILWDELAPEQVRAMPVLARLARQRARATRAPSAPKRA